MSKKIQKKIYQNILIIFAFYRKRKHFEATNNMLNISISYRIKKDSTAGTLRGLGLYENFKKTNNNWEQ